MSMLENFDVECSILGMAIDDISIAERISIYPDDTFYYKDTKDIFLAIRAIVKAGNSPDMITVMNRTKREDGTDCAVTIARCIELGYQKSQFKQHEAILMECRSRRIISAACEKALRDVSSPGSSLDEIKALIDPKAIDNPVSDLPGMDKAFVEWCDSIDKIKSKRIYTGISRLDEITGGISGGKLVILGARPGVGKSALALYMASHVSRGTGPVLYVSLEMDRAEIFSRIVACASGIDSSKVARGDLDIIEEASDAAFEVAKMPMTIVTDAVTPLMVRRSAGQMKRNGGLSMIVIDYLQLMKPDTKTSNRYEAVSEISRELKLMAMDLDVPVLALTQFNRQSEANNGSKKRAPTMAEARDSGSIEQDANIFLVFYQVDESDLKENDRWMSERAKRDGCDLMVLKVDKNRSGRTGMISLMFNKAHMDFKVLEA